MLTSPLLAYRAEGIQDVVCRAVAKRKASDLFVECLENEGVRHVFGIPGEETVDLNESLSRSEVEFVPVRHEQGGAYMADVYGRLTGRAGVCLGTLGPGAMNLTTPIADAYLDSAPLVALTGQGDLERMHKESHQYIDILSVLRPIVKWNARLNNPRIIPEVVRKAFKVAQQQKPGPTHIEIPEDVMEEEVDSEPIPVHDRLRHPEPSGEEIERAAELIRNASSPIVLAGNGAVRVGASTALREFSEATGIPVAETFMGKGLVDARGDNALGAVGLQAGDYEMAGFDEADVVITVGFDLVEHSPDHWNDKRDKTIVYIDTVPVEVDEYFVTEVDLVGDINRILGRLTHECSGLGPGGGSSRLRDVVFSHLEAAKDDDAFPMQPPRALYEIREALGDEDILISDVGPAQAVDRAHVSRLRAQHLHHRQRPGGDGLRAARGDRGQARPPGPQRGHRRRRRRLPHELPGARDRQAPAHLDGERDLGERAVRLDRLEAGQEVRRPLRHRLHEPRLRGAGAVLRPAGLALRVGRGLPAPAARGPRPRRALRGGAADRLLDRRCDLRGAGRRDGRHLRRLIATMVAACAVAGCGGDEGGSAEPAADKGGGSSLETRAAEVERALETGDCAESEVLIHSTRRPEGLVNTQKPPSEEECRGFAQYRKNFAGYQAGPSREFGTAAVVDAEVDGKPTTSVFVRDTDGEWVHFVTRTPPHDHELGTQPDAARFDRNAEQYVAALAKDDCATTFRLTNPDSSQLRQGKLGRAGLLQAAARRSQGLLQPAGPPEHGGGRRSPSRSAARPRAPSTPWSSPTADGGRWFSATTRPAHPGVEEEGPRQPRRARLPEGQRGMTRPRFG